MEGREIIVWVRERRTLRAKRGRPPSWCFTLGWMGAGGDACLAWETRQKGRQPALVIRESRRTWRSGRKLELQTPAEAPRVVGAAV